MSNTSLLMRKTDSRRRLNMTLISPEARWPLQSTTCSSLGTHAGWTRKVSWGKRLGHLLFLTRQCCGWLISTQSHNHLLIWGAGDVEILESLDKLGKHIKQYTYQVKKNSVTRVIDFVHLWVESKLLIILHWLLLAWKYWNISITWVPHKSLFSFPM